ncbi:hypothetical protein NDI45_20435 [Leptolyngbya sp. GB1-A1]|uniref:hypothetical protein n=1 Tax=Leptolyngbya sp. GB1-A1 TaxID=2933908 RepID=UPI0032970A92
MNFDPGSLSLTEIRGLLNTYEQQSHQLECDADAVLHQIQTSTYQLLIQLQQQKLELYAQSPVDIQRLQQFDSLTIAVLEFLKAQQSQSFSHLRQAQHNLRFQLKVNAGLSLYFQPLTEPEPLSQIDVDDLFS